MQKILFLDRDGTIVTEPPDDYQLDSLDKLEFLPFVIKYLLKIVEELDYILVMVTNQDGLGTKSFPEENFWPAQNKIINCLQNEGIVFYDVIIDKSFPHENLPTRKPGTKLLSKYLNNDNFNINESFVIGDRMSDMYFAQNLGCSGIFLNQNHNSIPKELKGVVRLHTNSWAEIYSFLKNH